MECLRTSLCGLRSLTGADVRSLPEEVEARARAAPKVELHVHLDGSFDFETMFTASKKWRNELPERRECPWEDPDTKEHPVVYPRTELGDRKDLPDFKRMVTSQAEVGLMPLLAVFYRYLPVVMGRHELIQELAYRFCSFQAENNVVYTEVRYSPHEFFEQEYKDCPPEGMARSVVEAVSRGIQRGEAEFGITVRQILCCINFSPQWSMDTVQTAVASRSLGIVGVDIASGEQHFGIDGIHGAHKAALDLAHENGLPITVHAGEDGPAENCRVAVDVYHARRLGHGYHLLDDPKLYERLRMEGVHLECCPTSSLLTKAVSGKDGWASHPIGKFVRDGMSVSINSDDPRVFDVDLRHEVSLAVRRIGLSAEEIHKCTLNAIDAAFCDQATKDGIRARVNSFWQA